VSTWGYAVLEQFPLPCHTADEFVFVNNSLVLRMFLKQSLKRDDAGAIRNQICMVVIKFSYVHNSI
jgi:hypothetical protein